MNPVRTGTGMDVGARDAAPPTSSSGESIHVMHIIGQIAVGGCEKQLLHLCQRMDRRRYKLTLCWYSRFPDELSQEFADAGVQLICLDKFRVSKLRFFVQLTNAIRRSRPDIVHTWLYSANAWGRWASVAARVPCIIASERVEILSSTWLYRWSERLLGRWSTLLVNSHSVARSLERHYALPLNRIHIAYNAVELPSCDPIEARAPVRQELGIPGEAKLILMIGRLDPQKNWPMFIRVASRVCRLRDDTYFIGIGIGALDAELLQMVTNEGLDGRVRFVGAKSDIARWLAAADLFCFTSDFEGFPNAVLEAMAAGLPVVCTEFGGAGELLTDSSVGYLVPKDDDESMARLALELLDDVSRRLSIGAAARALVKKRHDWAKLVRTMEQFYETTLAARKRPRKTFTPDGAVNGRVNY